MNTINIVKELEVNKLVFQQLLLDIAPEQYTWKPQAKKWSLLEIICHLYDEEREDFRARTRYALEAYPEVIPPIDPEGWVAQRAYMEQSYESKLSDFLQERDQSIYWLKDLKTPNWNTEIIHPRIGKVSARFFLENWLVHDYIHIRQILKVKYAYLEHKTDSNLKYAGNW